MIPAVSVCIVTYNQVKFIKECLDSILKQKTNFFFEIIVGDDCSTDGTSEIVKNYATVYPDKIKALLHSPNLGPTKNYLYVHNQARGEFVAHIDGDDYALPGKLQSLYDFLSLNPSCSIVWHRMIIQDWNGNKVVGMPMINPKKLLGKDRLDLRDLILYYGITGCHSGSMYRRSRRKIFSSSVNILDYNISLSLCETGYAAYLNKPLAVYRKHGSPVSITSQPKGEYIGKALLHVLADYSNRFPALRDRIAAQCLFQSFVRLYVGHALSLNFVLLAIKQNRLPKLSDLLRIWRIFNSSRNTQYRKKIMNSSQIENQ